MRAILKNNTYFLLPYLIFIIVGAVLLAINTKTELHLTFNSFHTTFFDTFFMYLTYLGDGVTALLVIIILLTVKYRYAVIMAVANVLAALVTQTLKHTVFSDVVRPKKLFDTLETGLYYIPGVENHLYNSFPSGHTTEAFSLYLTFALFTENKKFKFLFFTLALLVGYSRIYLSQHFFEDVYAGSVIGTVVTLIVYFYINKSKKSWLDKSLITSFTNQ